MAPPHMKKAAYGLPTGAAAVMMIMLLLVPAHTDAQFSCGTVSSSLLPCFSFLTKGTPKPVAGDKCCAGVQQLNGIATTTAVRQAICRCLETQAKSVKVLSSSAAALPGLCKVAFPYSVSTTQDCSKIP